MLKQGCDATASSGDQELPKQLKLMTRQMARDQGRKSVSSAAPVAAGSALENGGKVSSPFAVVAE